MDSSLPVFWRVLSWWLLFQSWSTLRFDDHRGIVPEDLEISETGLVGKLSPSKATGQDKRVPFRVLVIHPSAFLHQKDWLVTGWAILLKEAPYARDYLLPALANNYRGFKRKELTYHTAFAVQSRIVSLASYRVYGFSELLQAITTRPTAAATLCLRQQRFLGSASLIGTCWEVGLQRAVNVILEQRNLKYR